MNAIASTMLNEIAIVSVASPLVGGKAVEDLREKLHEMVHQKQRKLIIDLTGVPYANSEGIGVLVSAYISYKHRGWHIALCGLSREVNTIIAITKLNSVFDTYAMREEAITHLMTIP